MAGVVVVLMVAPPLALTRHRQAGAGPLWASEQAGGLGEYALPVRPGNVADLTAPVTNMSARPVTLSSAALITLDGQPSPAFAGARVAVRHVTIGDRGWPPSEASVPLAGSVVAPGATVYLYFGISGQRQWTNYPAAGLLVSYDQGGHHYQVRAWGPGVACVRASNLTGDQACDRAGQAALAATERLARTDAERLVRPAAERDGG
jgi:hypothetical protein